MVSSEEKRKFIEDMMNNSYQKVPLLELQTQLHELLLRDTNRGKLYKYRTFDKDGYALKNLQDGTLHCSKADAFNDPFDCKIGVTFESLYKARYEAEFDVVLEIIEKCIKVANEEIRLEECSIKEQRVITHLLESRILDALSDNDKIDSQEEKVALLKRNAIVVAKLFQIICSDEAFAESMGICVNMLPSIMENITPEGMLVLSEDNASLEEYARANGVVDDEDEVGLTMLLSQKLCPENNAAVADVQRVIDEMEYKLAENMKGLFYIGCLCTSNKNRLMWSHYADSHKGFCVEYDFSGSDEETLSKLPFPVVYSEERPLVPWEAALDNSEKNMEQAARAIMMGLLTKDKAWEYENEWRILVGVSEDSELVMPKVSCIYLGAAVEKENSDKILEIAKKCNIPVKQMTVDRGAYDLHVKEI